MFPFLLIPYQYTLWQYIYIYVCPCHSCTNSKKQFRYRKCPRYRSRTEDLLQLVNILDAILDSQNDGPTVSRQIWHRMTVEASKGLGFGYTLCASEKNELLDLDCIQCGSTYSKAARVDWAEPSFEEPGKRWISPFNFRQSKQHYVSQKFKSRHTGTERLENCGRYLPIFKVRQKFVIVESHYSTHHEPVSPFGALSRQTSPKIELLSKHGLALAKTTSTLNKEGILFHPSKSNMDGMWYNKQFTCVVTTHILLDDGIWRAQNAASSYMSLLTRTP